MRPLSVALAALAALPAAVAQEQNWSGNHGFRAVVTDEAGQPISGVTVVVRLAETARSGGPPPILTDGQGVAEVTGLAAGEWQVELRREGFMIVNSYLKLESGRRLQVGFNSRQRTGPFWAPMNVGYSDLGVPTAAATDGSARAIERAQRRAERREKKRQRQLEREDVARVIESPRPEPSPAGVRGVEPVSDDSEPTAEPATLRSPTPEPVPTRLLANRNLLPAGACPECAPGEWSVSTDWPAEARTAATVTCAEDLADRLKQATSLIEAHLPAHLRAYAGALTAADGNDVLRLLPPEHRNDVETLLVPVTDPERSCQAVGILLPKGGSFIGFRYEAADLSSRGGCLPERPCDIGDAQWRGNPTIHRHDHGALVYAVFENASVEKRREANLTVYFRPPPGWRPPR